MKASKQLTLVTKVPHLIPGVKEVWQWHNGHLRMMSLLPSHQHCCYPHHPLLPCIFCHCRGRFYSAIHPALGDYSKAQLIRFWLSSCSVKCMQCNVQQQCTAGQRFGKCRFWSFCATTNWCKFGLGAVSSSLSRQCALCNTAAAAEPWRVKAALSKSRCNDEAAAAASFSSCP